jgi:thioredoxin-related protein
MIKKFDIFGVPTIVFLDEKGTEVKDLRMNGYVPPDEFVDSVRSSRLGNRPENVDPTGGG